ncbi:MAG: hypothetical protein R6X02_01770 [Enhygromyxa sp.]
MDALFIVVAELLIIPLILWALIVLELTVGVAASVFSIFAGRRSPAEAVANSWRAIRRKLLWSLIFVTSGLLIADLVLFDAIVSLALGSANDREELEVSFAHAEGSFIVGRIELHQLSLAGVRGELGDPSARYQLFVDRVVIDVDTPRLLAAAFALEELSLEGVRGSFDRLRAEQRKPAGEWLAREFSVERIHFGQTALTLRDHTGEAVRELELGLSELDIGPVASESVFFDLLYRTRGRGSIAGNEFSLTSVELGGVPQTTLELRGVSLDALADPLERAAGVRAGGSADLTLTSRYREADPEPKVELAVALRLRALELEAGAEASMATRVMLDVAARELTKLGSEFPLEFELAVQRSELLGLRSLAESGLIERLADGIITALRQRLTRGSG